MMPFATHIHYQNIISPSNIGAKEVPVILLVPQIYNTIAIALDHDIYNTITWITAVSTFVMQWQF